ncbi:MAG: 2-amino-4-hydroxy-6-hydroxymethyldihydropteridine diphosphokinase [Burkholderiaceae bacterium]
MASSIKPASVVPGRAFIGMGANLGLPEKALRDALDSLHALPGTRVRAASRWYRSTPVDAPGPDYLNAVAMVETTLGPHALLARLQAIEAAAGRERGERHAPRTLDLDLLVYDARVIDDAGLQVPHPRLTERAFVLRPLFELAPSLVLPDGRLIADLTARIRDQPLAPAGDARWVAP